MSSRASNEKSLINTNITDDTENNDNENTKLNEEEVDKDEEEVDKDEEDVDNDEEEAEIDDEDVEIDDEDVEIDDEEEDEFDLDEDGEEVITKTVGKKSLKKTKITAEPTDNIMEFLNVDQEEDESSDEEDGHMNGMMENDEYDEYDDDDEDPDVYFQKFDEEININYLLDHHPTEFNKNYDEIETLCNIMRDENNNIIDPLHRTLPYLSKYERTRVLGQRAKQLNSGSKPFVPVPDSILDGYIIAEMELLQKRIPFIIQRPLHGGACEYWKLRDLEIL